MSTRLRVATSGPLATANDFAVGGAAGQFLQRIVNPIPGQPDTVRWAAAGGGGGGPPFSNVLFVDKGTTVPVPSQTGAPSAPFSTLTVGIAAAIDGSAIMCTPGDYTGEGPLVLPNKFLAIMSMWSTNVHLAGQSDVTGFLPFQLGDVTIFNDQQLLLYGAVPGTVHMGTSASSCVGVQTDFGPVTGNGELIVFDGSTGGDIAATGIIASNSNISSNNLNIDNSAAYAVNFRSCAFLTGPGQRMAFGSPGGVAIMDAVTNRTWLKNVITTNGRMQVIDTLPQASKVVAVPGILAGDIAYVDVDLTGTELEGLLQFSPICVNPTSDLMAAGAGGSLLSYYMGNTNSARLCFSGVMTGQNATFVITALAPMTAFVPPP